MRTLQHSAPRVGLSQRQSDKNTQRPVGSVIASAQPAQLLRPSTTVSPSGLISPHPDAVRRRQEAEQRRLRRENERGQLKTLEAAGLKWWQGSLPSNMTYAFSPASFADHVRQQPRDKLLLVQFFTEDCYTCKTMHPKLKKIAADNPDMSFLKINGSDEAFHVVFEELQITKVPYFFLYKNGEVVSHFTASLNPEKLSYLRMQLMLHKSAARRVAA